MIAAKFYQTVDTEYGPVSGIKKFGTYGDEYFSFQGIPYMKAPVGKLRFRDAEPPEKWTDTLDAVYEGPGFCCRDYIHGRLEGELDAMHVNIYTKNVKPEKLTPVMVFIHGGSFISGSGRTDLFGPDYLIQKDVILVTFNYRLGVFGFLSLNDPSLNVPGNAGLKDQVFALKFIKRNIQNFGGDPNNITIMGESAGGVSVHYHTISNQSKNLFQRAVPISGCALHNIWSYVPNRNWAHKLAIKLGWDEVGGEKEILELLEEAEPFDIVKAHESMLYKEDLDEEIFEPFWPVIEPYKTETCFIPKDPLLMAREGWGKDIDIMIGGCSNEGLFATFYFPNFGEEFYNVVSIERFIGTELRLKKNDPNRKIYADQLKELYYGNDEISLDNLQGYIDFISDIYFWYGIYRSTLVRNKSDGTGNTFIFRFDCDLPKLNLSKVLADVPSKYKGACHMDDLTYLFKSQYLPAPQMNTKEYEAIRKTVSIFTSFAATGNPNNDDLNDINLQATSKTSSEITCFTISEEVKNMEVPEFKKFDLWNSLYDKENLKIY